MRLLKDVAYHQKHLYTGLAPGNNLAVTRAVLLFVRPLLGYRALLGQRALPGSAACCLGTKSTTSNTVDAYGKQQVSCGELSLFQDCTPE